jgi:hypothetical protein
MLENKSTAMCEMVLADPSNSVPSNKCHCCRFEEMGSCISVVVIESRISGSSLCTKHPRGGDGRRQNFISAVPSK